jgi:DNA primase
MSVDLSDVVAGVDLAAMVEARTGPGRCSGGRWTFPCPNPDHQDRSPSFTVSTDRRGRWRWRCWSQCGRSGDALDLLVWLDGLTIAEAAAKIRQYAGQIEPVSRPKPKPAPQKPTVTVETTTRAVPDEVADRVMAEHLEGRGWPPEAAQRFGLSVVVDRWGRLRIRYPFHGWTGDRWDVVSWQDRATSHEQRPKWLTPQGAVLPPFGMQALDTDDPVTGLVICEGPADTVTAALALEGRPDVVAVGIPGANGWRPGWSEMLAGVEAVVIAADPDEAGQRLVAAVMADLRRPAVVLDLSAGDLTETAKSRGLAAVGDLLAAAVTLTRSERNHPGERDREPVKVASDPVGFTPLWVTYLDLERLGPNRWRCCDRCGRESLTSVGKRCYLKPGCEGRYVEINRMGVAV